MKSKIDKVLLIISKMMNEENDEHSEIIAKLQQRYKIETGNLLYTINLVHYIKIELLEEVYNKIKKEIR